MSTIIGSDKFNINLAPDSSRDFPAFSSSTTPRRHLQPTPVALAADSSGRLLISCLDSNTILRYSIRDHKFEVVAGQPGQPLFRDGMGASQSRLSDALGLMVDPNQNVYFADVSFGAIRTISPQGLKK